MTHIKDSIDFTCIICLEQLTLGILLKDKFRCDCNVIIHESCLYQWINVAKRCPICRKMFVVLHSNIIHNDINVTSKIMNFLTNLFDRYIDKIMPDNINENNNVINFLRIIIFILLSFAFSVIILLPCFAFEFSYRKFMGMPLQQNTVARL